MLPVDKSVLAPKNSEPKATVPPAKKAYAPLDFYKRWLKQNIKCKCTNGIVIEGILLAYNPYELFIGVADAAEIVLSKHAIMFTALVKPTSAEDKPKV